MAAEVAAFRRAGLAGASHALFGAAILCSALLLFLVQPMVGKRVIPLFGGAPGVWTLCLAFYQSVLFLGYAYAHALVRFARPTVQLGIHAVVVLVAARIATRLPAADFSLASAVSPTSEILRLLVVYVGLPFFVLSSTGPLVQAWFARRHPKSSPYPLYALSNAGSFLALFAYPFLVEPRVGLLETMDLWSTGFLITGALLLACAAIALRPGRTHGVATRPVVATDPDHEAPGPIRLRSTLWLLLSATAVVVMMSITNHLTRDVASVPFLWILPLAAYLATFVLCFSFERAYRRSLAVVVVIVCLALGGLRTAVQIDLVGAGALGAVPGLLGLPIEIARLTFLVFGVCWVLHGELHALRPRSDDLTRYYLWISLGGALGGLFVGIGAPRLFSGHGELVLSVVLSMGLVAVAIGRARRPPAPSVGRRVAVAWLAVVALGTHEVWVAINPDAQQIHQERNFFGVLRVLESGEGPSAQRVLLHGSTTHGLQFVSGSSQAIPTSYYGRGSALAAALSLRQPSRPARIGVVGLGIGTVAAYGRRGDLIRFYEIDPGVVRVARDEGLFTFLRNSAATIEIDVGDARLRLEDERKRGERQDFDLLLVDAFSSDAVPVHLMTTEGFAPYVAALAEDGLLLVHLSSRHFELGPVVARVAEAHGLPHLLVESTPMPALQTQGAHWAVVARDPERLNAFRRASARLLARFGLPPARHDIRTLSPEALSQLALWTDDYSDLFGALKR